MISAACGRIKAKLTSRDTAKPLEPPLNKFLGTPLIAKIGARFYLRLAGSQFCVCEGNIKVWPFK